MATLKRRIFEARDKVKKAKFLLDSVNANAKRTGKPTPAQPQAQKAYDAATDELNTLLKIQTKRTADKKAGPLDKATVSAQAQSQNKPYSLDNKILQEMMNDGIAPQIIGSGAFSSMLVYDGQTTTMSETSPTGGKYAKTKDAVTYTNSEIGRFHTDEALKKSIIATAKRLNPQADEIDAFNLWKEAVTKAAELYAGGTGLKIKPLDLLNRESAKSKGAAPYTGPETTLARTVYDSATVKSWMEKGLLESLRKTKLSPEDMADLEASIMEMTKKYNKTVVTDNRTGKRVIEEKPGFSQAQVEAKIKQFAKEKDPEAYERAKSLSFFDWGMRLG